MADDSRFPIPDSRVGLGYDSHRFAPGGPLVLAGNRIPVDFTLAGHSDGDAIAHAVTDAANRGADSMAMLRAAVARVGEAGYSVVNADVVVVAETPKIGPYRDAMRHTLAESLGTGVDRVSIKGKTNEQMGWIGRGEGLACLATVLIARSGG